MITNVVKEASELYRDEALWLEQKASYAISGGGNSVCLRYCVRALVKWAQYYLSLGDTSPNQIENLKSLKIAYRELCRENQVEILAKDLEAIGSLCDRGSQYLADGLAAMRQMKYLKAVLESTYNKRKTDAQLKESSIF